MVEATLRLFILRHGKSDWSTGQPDFDRPLAERGRTGAQRVGAWMKDEGLVPDQVISSPARRARETAESICRSLGLKERGICFDEKSTGGRSQRCWPALRTMRRMRSRCCWSGTTRDSRNCVYFLTQGPLTQPDDGKLLPTAALAVLRPLTDWRSLGQGGAELLSITRPGEM